MKMEIKGSIIKDVISGVSPTREGTSNGDKEALIGLNNDNWMIKSKGAEGVMMFACLVPESSMESYSKNNVDFIGFDMDDLGGAVSNRGSVYTIEWDNHKIVVSEGSGPQFRLRTINPDYIQGAKSGMPSVDYPYAIKGGLEPITTYISKAKGVIGADAAVMSVRDGDLYLYSRMDDDEIQWKLDEIEVARGDSTNLDCVFSLDFLKEMHFEDEGIIYLGNDKPMKVVMETGDGVKMTYFLAPRITDDSSSAIRSVPDEYID